MWFKLSFFSGGNYNYHLNKLGYKVKSKNGNVKVRLNSLKDRIKLQIQLKYEVRLVDFKELMVMDFENFNFGS